MTRRWRRWQWRSRAARVAGLLLSLSRAASAEEHRLALIEPDAELDRAVALALSPWGMSVTVKHGAGPGASLPIAGERARVLALEWDVSALVWLSPVEDGSLLWIYETETDSVSTRHLADAPPFTSPQAASVALTIKSLLRTRASRSASASAATITRIATPAPVPAQPPLTPAEDLPGSVDPPPTRFSVTGELSLRYFAREAHEVRGALGGIWWVRVAPSTWGIGLKASAGPGAPIRSPGFDGELRQLSLSAALFWRLAGNRFLTTLLMGGASAHYMELTGFHRELQRGTERERLAPSLDVGSDVALSLMAGTSVGFGARALYFPLRERYLVRGASVFQPWPVAAELGVRLGVDLL